MLPVQLLLQVLADKAVVLLFLLLMLLGTGVLAALTRRNLALPLATLAAMFAGAVCGHLFGDVLGMETLIAVSLLVAAGAVLLPKPIKPAALKAFLSS